MKTEQLHKIQAGFFIFFLAICLLITVQASADEGAISRSSIVGVWACQSVYAGSYTGRSCQSWPWLKLNSDGNYTWGSEKGRWSFKGNILHFSGRTGKGSINADGKLVVDYQVKGKQYQQIMYKRQ